MYAVGLTDVGKVRDHNEDVIYYTTSPIGSLPNLFIVADGMGGHNAGEIASAKSLEYSVNFITGAECYDTKEDILDILKTAIVIANTNVFKLSTTNPAYSGMGTTFSACTIYQDTMIISHVGDSRIYTICPKEITQITKDHSFVQEMIDAGEITKEEARTHSKRNMITKVLGCDLELTPDGFFHDISDAHYVLLCSDGLTDMLSDEEIKNIVLQEKDTQSLIDAANLKGGKDNISAIIIDVRGETT
ncbi:MAG: Stp1/IreP family PP2C-type Ser/Thr phosphatase [Defluviitaleaceae bacterium]|nr:Stp1/IreP family PP2C-type Ser/Thr phosphatase [Defluviitaleaceae bacterium]